MERNKEEEMKYRELIKTVQHYSGFSDSESKDSLDSIVAALAVHLNDGERKDFASQLPFELQGLALAVYPTEALMKQDLFEQFHIMQGVDHLRAKKQLLSAWKALKQALSPGQVDHIRAQLPSQTVALLH